MTDITGADNRKCFEYLCPKFPKCGRSVSCCGVDDSFEDITISADQCFLHPDKPYFIEKKTKFYRP